MQYIIRYKCETGIRIAVAHKTNEFDNMSINDIKNQLSSMMSCDVKILTVNMIEN